MKVQEGKVYHINYDGKIPLKARVFRIYEQKGRQMVEWGVTNPAILESLEDFLRHLEPPS